MCLGVLCHRASEVGEGVHTAQVGWCPWRDGLAWLSEVSGEGGRAVPNGESPEQDGGSG